MMMYLRHYLVVPNQPSQSLNKEFHHHHHPWQSQKTKLNLELLQLKEVQVLQLQHQEVKLVESGQLFSTQVVLQVLFP